MKSMRKWLVNYERRRHPSEVVSSKFDFQGDWRELQQIYLPELGMHLGPAWNSLKKLWKSYKIAGRTGEPRSDTAWKINRLQVAMGLEKSDFPELEGMVLDDEWDEQDQGEELPPEWSAEDEQLRREEREAEQENDDWWISD
jgi:hypothetical protein